MTAIAFGWLWLTSVLASLVAGLVWGWRQGSEYWKRKAQEARGVAELATREASRLRRRAGILE